MSGSHMSGSHMSGPNAPVTLPERLRSALALVGTRFRRRIGRMALFTAPTYLAMYALHQAGVFDALRDLAAGGLGLGILPVEAAGVVVFSAAAEFSARWPLPQPCWTRGSLDTAQTALALVLGTIVATPIRALRHQLPSHTGIFTPGWGWCCWCRASCSAWPAWPPSPPHGGLPRTSRRPVPLSAKRHGRDGHGNRRARPVCIGPFVLARLHSPGHIRRAGKHRLLRVVLGDLVGFVHGPAQFTHGLAQCPAQLGSGLSGPKTNRATMPTTSRCIG